MLKAAIYTRVSSEEQVKGYSLGSQDEQLREFCRKEGYQLNEKHVFKEEGISGVKESRPALDKLIEAVVNNEIDIVLICKIDRLSRNLKLLLRLDTQFEKHKVGIKAIKEQFDTSTPIGRFMFHTLGSFAEFEREMIRQRTVEGQIKYLQEGHWNSGIEPYGYNRNPKLKKLEINEEEAKIVRKMYEWRTKEGLSLYKIQERLNDLRIPTKYDNVGLGSRKINGKGFWRTRTIGRILSSELYAGTFTRRKYKYLGRIKNEENLRPKEEWITIETPQIVSKELFAKAQAQKKRNIRYSKRKTTRTYLFGGMLICGLCGSMYGSRYETRPHGIAAAGRTRYTCYKRFKYISDIKCAASSLAETRIEEPVWEKVVELLKNPELVIKELDKMNNEDVQVPKERINELDKLIKTNKEKDERLLSLYESGGIDKDVYLARVDKIKKSIETYENERGKYIEKANPEKSIASKSDVIKELYSRYCKNIDKMNYEQKRELFKMVIDKIVIQDDKADIHVNITKPAFEGQTTLPQYQNQSDLA